MSRGWTSTANGAITAEESARYINREMLFFEGQEAGSGVAGPFPPGFKLSTSGVIEALLSPEQRKLLEDNPNPPSRIGEHVEFQNPQRLEKGHCHLFSE